MLGQECRQFASVDAITAMFAFLGGPLRLNRLRSFVVFPPCGEVLWTDGEGPRMPVYSLAFSLFPRWSSRWWRPERGAGEACLGGRVGTGLLLAVFVAVFPASFAISLSFFYLLFPKVKESLTRASLPLGTLALCLGGSVAAPAGFLDR